MPPTRTGLGLAAAAIFACACAAHNAASAVHRAPAAPRTAEVVDLLQQRDYTKLTAKLWDSSHAKELAGALDTAWNAALADGGHYRGIDETRSFEADGKEVEASLLRFDKNIAELEIRWTKDSRITSLRIVPGAVQARALALARDLLSGDPNLVYGEHFSSAMKAALPRSTYLETIKAVRKTLGENALIADITVEYRGLEIATVQYRPKVGKGGLDLQLAFRKGTDQLEGLYFLPPNAAPAPDSAPPSYADPTKYTERELTVAGLPGTLTLPRTAAAVPAVVLVAGSGPHDRDETVLANKPFRDLALGLATRGIAVLRFEKRTYGKNLTTLGDPTQITFDRETVDDAVAAVSVSMAVSGVDPARVYVVGHSQGATAAPRIAEHEPRVRGLVLLAAPARPLEDLLLEQTRYLASIDRSNQDAANAALAELEKQVARVKSVDLASASPKELPLGVPASWWLSERDYAPLSTAKQLKKPLLLLQGDRDFQVTATDFALWKSELGNETWASLRMLPGLNHLFETGSGEPSPSEYEKPSHVSEVVITQIADFILGAPR